MEETIIDENGRKWIRKTRILNHGYGKAEIEERVIDPDGNEDVQKRTIDWGA